MVTTSFLPSKVIKLRRRPTRDLDAEHGRTTRTRDPLLHGFRHPECLQVRVHGRAQIAGLTAMTLYAAAAHIRLAQIAIKRAITELFSRFLGLLIRQRLSGCGFVRGCS